ncbi:Phenylcoumaran benzylic ether reductase Betv6 [Asimina triloba]
MAEKSKILIIGGTGYIGKYIVEASAKGGHPTFLLARKSTVADPSKAPLLDKFKSLGGDMYDHESLVKAIKQVDVVISTVGHEPTADQVKIIDAIKEAGNIKRFLPSEFGNDVDRVVCYEPGKSAFATKAEIRRAVEASGIPYTFVSCNFFAGYFLPSLAQPGATAPPRDKLTIFGDGNAKGNQSIWNDISSVVTTDTQILVFALCSAIFVKEEDIGEFTIKAVDDPRTVNKILYLRPAGNIYSFNELVSTWEKKIGKTLERIYLPDEQIHKNIQESPFPINLALSIMHCAFVNGCHTNFDIDPSIGVEGTELYPDVKYTTIDKYLDQFV